MSIFPKRITSGENCIIHLRFANSCENSEVIKYVLKVISPNNEVVLNINKSMVLGVAGTKNFVREVYYNVNTNKNFLPGKYIVDFYLYCKGIKVESMTKEIDYFNIEKLSYFIDDNNTYITNESDEETEFYVYNDKASIQHYIIKGKDSIILKGTYNYIQYANNKVDVIRKGSEKMYYKNPEYKLKGNKLMNINTNKEYRLTKKEIIYYSNVGNFIESIPLEFKKFIEDEIFLPANAKNII